MRNLFTAIAFVVVSWLMKDFPINYQLALIAGILMGIFVWLITEPEEEVKK